MGGASVVKVLAVQAQGPEFESPAPTTQNQLWYQVQNYNLKARELEVVEL